MNTEMLRTVAAFSIGLDLPGRVAAAADVQKRQSEALLQAADEIDRLEARLQDLESKISTGPTGNNWFTIPEPPGK
jgi:hypothetical protein